MISFSNPGNVIKQVMAAPDGYESITGLAKAVLILCFGVVCVGCLLNKGDLKFSRSHTTDCSKGLLALNLEDSHICCDSPSHESNWICIASFDSLNYVFSSRWAFVIPLVPWVLNSALCDKRIVDSAKRIFVYVVLIAIRTVS